MSAQSNSKQCGGASRSSLATPPAQLEKYVFHPLAKWCANTKFEDIPDEIVLQAKLCLLDTLGCNVAGFSHPNMQALIKAEKEICNAKRASILVSGDKLSVPSAAKVNSCMANIYELDDNVGDHASVSVVPMALALAEANHLSGKALLTSIVLGDEVAGRMHNCCTPWVKLGTECCITPTDVNALASGITAAKLLNYDAERIFNTMNLGLTLAPVAIQLNVKYGAKIKPMLIGAWQAYVGYQAAIYASYGLTAMPDSFENEWGGWLPSVFYKWDLTALTKGLGQSWVLERPDRKLHASCGFTHAPIDGSREIVRKNNISLEDIDKIRVGVINIAYEFVGKPPVGKLAGTSAMFYLPYLLTTALIENRHILISDSTEEATKARLSDPKFAKLMESVEVIADEAISGDELFFACNLCIITKDGKRYDEFVKDAKGRGENQFSPQEVEDKFRMLASSQFDKKRIDKIIDMVDKLQQLDDTSSLVEMLTNKNK